MDRILVDLLPVVLSYLAGTALIIVEVFIPGFGLPGISGILLLALGGWLTARTFSLAVAVVVMVIVIAILAVAIIFFLRSASKGRLKNSPFFLKTQETIPEKKKNVILVGKQGKALTALRPAGIGLFEDIRVDVIADGEFIEANETIKVAEVKGNRIVVKKT